MEQSNIYILSKLITELVKDMRYGISGRRYELPKLHNITHADFDEFDISLKDACNVHKIDVSIFHPRRIKIEKDERIYCRLTSIGFDNYHVCIYYADKEIDI